MQPLLICQLLLLFKFILSVGTVVYLLNTVLTFQNFLPAPCFLLSGIKQIPCKHMVPEAKLN